jgi:peptidoglycan/xylan/chitin deacetylase (PgdA/CDA1 family)
MYFVNMYLTKTTSIIKQFYRDYVWSIDTKQKELFLTFDDGPHPEITPFVLDTLAAYGAKATFFCIGKNVAAYPDVYQRIIDEGHAVGNHTYHHLNGWDSGNMPYWRDVLQTGQLVASNLFRPPYGKIKRSQAKALKNRYHIVMWDVLTWDFQQETSKEQVLQNATGHAEPGSIIVFHDSEKAWNNLSYALPQTLRHFTEKGFAFRPVQLP